MSIEGTHQMTFGIDDLIDNNVSLVDNEEIYLSLVERLTEEQAAETLPVNRCSTEIVSNTCRVYRYYSEETTLAVQTHFTRSLQEGLRTTMNIAKIGSEIPSKPTGRTKRKPAKRKSISAASPYNSCSSIPPAAIHPYARVTTKPQTTYLVPTRVEIYPKIDPYYTTQPLPHGFQYDGPSSGYTVKSEYTNRGNVVQQPAYTAFCNGKTLIEVYSPTVGRGFNPRYNSLLMEPTVQPYLPPIAGQSGATQADTQTFLQLAVEFNIPNCNDVRLFGKQ